MIIKSKSYKTLQSFTTVTRYILRESEQEQGFVFTRFIKGGSKDINTLAEQFALNEQYRVHKRKNSVKLYMDILSFHKADSNKISNEDLLRIAKQYIKLRAPKSIAVATVHRHEKEHVHLHICLSGIAYRTGKSIRISKSDFLHKVKLPMEEFQREHFPQLGKSSINHNPSIRKKKVPLKALDYGYQKRGKTSEREQLFKVLETAFLKANNEADFYKLLHEKGINTYQRKGKIVGVQTKRKYRFNTLGYSPQLLQQIGQDLTKDKRLSLLKKIREKQQHDKDRNR